ncbi:MAG: molybdopterin-dependent oxidoreductase [Chloroflexi bacterium]|nr:molybdopterin-dependent oxidoreductase [Chloroflexota bacterium]
MQDISITVNGLKIKGYQGETILDICRRNDIYIPTLCHLEGVSDVGACRLCVVEIDGERRINPSCTYPAREGLVVRTSTPKIENYRRQILELLFTERNHFCMYCEQSGDCELQTLAYRYQMDHVRYSYLYPSLPMDTLSENLAIEHNRCILCGRCIRVCDQLAGVHTLDFGGRGINTMVTIDVNQELGKSTCTQCGACFQACPTGAIVGKLSAYKDRTAGCQAVKPVCAGCGIACELNVFVKDNNNLVKIESPSLPEPKGPLCRIGRFELLNNTRERIISPLIRDTRGKLKESTMDKALSVITNKVVAMNGSFGGMISPHCTNEALAAFKKLLKGQTDTLDGENYRLFVEAMHQLKLKGEFNLPLEEIEKSDCILLIGADVEKTHPIVGTFIRRAVRQNNAKLIVLDAVKDFPAWTNLWLNPKAGTEETLIKELGNLVGNGTAKSGSKVSKPGKVTGVEAAMTEAAAAMLKEAKNSIVIYGNRLSKKSVALTVGILNLAQSLNKADSKLRLVLLSEINSQGAWVKGIAKLDLKADKPRGLYLLLTDDEVYGDTLKWLKGIEFLVVQASYVSPVTEIADVVLPSPNWAERSGTYLAMDGRKVRTKQVTKSSSGLLQDKQIIEELSRKVQS